MNILVCYPADFSIPAMPFGGLALFNACLRKAGHRVLPLDVSAISFNRLIRRENLEHYYALLDGEMARGAEQNGSADLSRLHGLARLLAMPRELILGAEEAAQRLRNPSEYYDPDQMRLDHHALLSIVQMFGTVRPRFDPRNERFSDEIYPWLDAEMADDPWVRCYEEALRPKLDEFDPQLVAITVPFSTQLGGALRYARWVKERYPNAKVVAGGTGISDAEHILCKDKRFFKYIDFVITGEGEEALVELAAGLENGSDLSEVPALYRLQDGEIVEPTCQRFVDMSATPVPDFTDVDWDQYISPERIASLTTSRGCYYGKCTFCPESFRLRFRRRGSSEVWKDLRQIATEQGINNFMFWDPLTPPAMLTEISERSREEGIDINWMAQVKFDKVYTDEKYVETLAKGGCRWLQFGFESGVQRVLDDMGKGNDLNRIETILDRLSAANISVGVFFFVGFPTESEEDARETWRYLARRRDRIHFTGYIGTFGLGHDVPVYKDPTPYGIDIVTTAAGDIGYKRHDGLDWDAEYLHQTFSAHGDLYLIESGAALLYSKNRPELVPKIVARKVLGPPSFIRSDNSSVQLSLPKANDFYRWEMGGQVIHFAYVGLPNRFHELEPEEFEMALSVRDRGGCTVAELRQSFASDPEFDRHVKRLIDHGIVGSTAMGPEEPVESSSENYPAIGSAM